MITAVLGVLFFGFADALWRPSVLHHGLHKVLLHRTVLTTLILGLYLLLDIQHFKFNIPMIGVGILSGVIAGFGLYFLAKAFSLETTTNVLFLNIFTLLIAQLFSFILFEESIRWEYYTIQIGLSILTVLCFNGFDFKLRKGLLYGLLASLCFGIAYPLAGIPIKEIGFKTTIFIQEITILFIFLCFGYYIKKIRKNFEKAVKKRVETSDRPIACLLSGGLDSSLVCSIVSKYIKTPLKTFSIGLADSEDLKYARKVASFLGTDHSEIVVTEKDFFDVIPEVIKTIESYDTTTVRASAGNYLLGKYIKEHSECKVIFNGDGSDELAGGYLYFHKAPDMYEFDKECRRLLHNIHCYDVLRSDRCISVHGLEPRTPFLDRSWVDFYLSIPIEYRCHTTMNKCEKFLIRKAFEGYLPDEVLWRKKEAFSDGVSGLQKSWYQIIQEHIDELPKEETSKMHEFIQIECNKTHNKPITNEQKYYRYLFEKNYKSCEKVIPYFWMPKYVEATDSSARTLDVYKKV